MYTHETGVVLGLCKGQKPPKQHGGAVVPGSKPLISIGREYGISASTRRKGVKTVVLCCFDYMGMSKQGQTMSKGGLKGLIRPFKALIRPL